MMSEGAGRPTTYTQEMATLICARMAEGESLRSICRDKTTPAMSTVFLWVSKHKEFSEQYKLAMASRADAMFEEMFDIADDGQNDWMEILDKDGDNIGWRVNGENIQRSRVRIDTRKWALSKMMPKKYSDKSPSDTSEIDIQIKLLELQKLQREVNPPKVNAPDDDYKLPLTPDEPIPDDPIL